MPIERPKRVEIKSNSSIIQSESKTKTSSASQNILQAALQKNRKEQLISTLNKIKSEPRKVQDLVKIIDNSNNSYDVFKKYTDYYEDRDDLIALGLLSEEEVQLFSYIQQNNLEKSVVSTDIDLYDQNVINGSSNEFKRFLADDPEYTQSTSLTDNDTIKLPHIYLLGSDKDLELINVMSLNTQVKLLNNLSQMDDFENDLNKKIVIIFPDLNKRLANRYNEIFEKQNFKTYSGFTQNKDNVKDDEIFPLTRKNLIRKILI